MWLPELVTLTESAVLQKTIPTKRVFLFFFHLEIEIMSIFWFLNPVEGSFTTDLMRCKLTRIDLITTACIRWNLLKPWGGTRMNQEFFKSWKINRDTLLWFSGETTMNPAVLALDKTDWNRRHKRRVLSLEHKISLQASPHPTFETRFNDVTAQLLTKGYNYFRK